MGAGDQNDHYIQDAAELYWILLIQRMLNERNLSLMDNIVEKETEFNEYCSERNIVEMFNISDYKMNMDSVSSQFVVLLIEKYPGRKMDLKNIEVEGRNEGKKGDFSITFDIGGVISVSLKNYRCGYNSIQLCSGTWHSIINNYALQEANGPGMYIDCVTNKKFRAQKKSLKQRDQNYESLDLSQIPILMKDIDEILVEIKNKYVTGEDTRVFTEEVKQQWIQDCRDYGHRGIDIVIKCLDLIPKEKVLAKFLEKTDLCHSEELLLIGPNGNMMCSLFNDKYKSLLSRVNSENSSISYIKHEKSLRMSINDLEGEILHVDIPFTLQKNGAWYLPKEEYEGTQYHSGEKKELVYGERRPKKSKEINTSTNMWFKISDYV